MKKLLFTIVSLIVCSAILAQGANRKFTPSIKVGAGIWTEEPSVLNAELGIQGEYKPKDRFSVYANISYNRMFTVEEITYGVNFMNFMAGPRLYLTKSFFTGVGAGYLLAFAEGASGGSFAFSPHVGVDRPKTQWTLNYTAATAGGISGFISLAAAFKFGTKRASN
jgi:hypothetical protein